MLKLLIVDDEEVICQTIATLIDWKSIGIELIGTCCDGIEAYHTILDETPDIVMTDIRMPGISGLELVERIAKMDLNIHFVILSGYGEFEYAKRAMHCGVRHYLLKPCDEAQITDCIREVIHECHQDMTLPKAPHHQNAHYQSLQQKLVQSILFEGCGLSHLSAGFFLPYEKYMDLYSTPYELACFDRLEEKSLHRCLEKTSTYLQQKAPSLPLYQVYMANRLLLFYPVSRFDSRAMQAAFGALDFPSQDAPVRYETTAFPNLAALFTHLIAVLRRYDVHYFLDGKRIILHYNYEAIASAESLFLSALDADETLCAQTVLDNLQQLLNSISNPDFLVQLADTVLITLAARLPDAHMEERLDFLSDLHKETDADRIRTLIYEQVETILRTFDAEDSPRSPFIEKTVQYLDAHFSDQSITLKEIAENYLYMNVNYVSRCFVKETGEKFSAYLARLRVERAKEILSSGDADKIKNVAVLVGCGNNPYYFSRMFKKYTGLTPSAYLRRQSSK